MGNFVGVAVRTTKGCPHLRGVILDASGTFVRSFQHQSSQGPDHEMLHEVGQALASQLVSQPFDAVVIREAGFAARSGATGAVKTRLRAEGVALGVARSGTSRVAVMDIKAIAYILGMDAAKVEATVDAMDLGAFGEACSAALAAAALP